MTVVYVDSFVLLNFVVNALLLACAGKLDNQCVSPGRCAVGAALGAGYALLALLPGWTFLMHPIGKAAAAVAMLLASYGCSDRLLRIGALFLILSCAFGGGLMLLSVVWGEEVIAPGILSASLGVRGILIAAALSYGCLCLLLGSQFSHGGIGRELTWMTLTHRGRSMRLLALRDSGNTLRDTLTGRPVVVVEGEKLVNLLPELSGLGREVLSDPVALLDRLADTEGVRLQLLPYRAVGVDCGLLAALRMDRVECGGQVYRNCLTALSPTAVSDGGNYSALIGADQ